MISPDRRTVIQILGSLMHRPEFLNDTDRFQLEPSDFVAPIDKYIFTAIYNLYIGGAEVIHAIDVDNALQESQRAKDLLEKNNGSEFIQDCEVYAEPQNFAYYYNRFKKINLLRDLQKDGYNISEFYSENTMDEDHFAINDRFEKLTSEQIVNRIKGKVAELENKYVISSVVEETKATDGIDELIKDLKEAPEVGVRLQGEIFNMVVRGGRKGKLYLRSGSSGKTLPLHVVIHDKKFIELLENLQSR